MSDRTLGVQELGDGLSGWQTMVSIAAAPFLQSR